VISRFLELTEIAGDAIMTAFRRDTALTWGPRTFFGGVEHDLAQLCIAAR